MFAGMLLSCPGMAWSSFRCINNDPKYRPVSDVVMHSNKMTGP